MPLPAFAHVPEASRVDCPNTEAALLAGGVGALSRPMADAFHGCDPAAAGATIRLIIAERVHQPPPRLNLAWTGPELGHCCGQHQLPARIRQQGPLPASRAQMARLVAVPAPFVGVKSLPDLGSKPVSCCPLLSTPNPAK